jgi:hypothetical protein
MPRSSRFPAFMSRTQTVPLNGQANAFPGINTDPYRALYESGGHGKHGGMLLFGRGSVAGRLSRASWPASSPLHGAGFFVRVYE